MEITAPGAYFLIIVGYNWDYWKKLEEDERKEAEEVAEELFPEKIMRLPQMSPDDFQTFIRGLSDEQLATLLRGLSDEELAILLSGSPAVELAAPVSALSAQQPRGPTAEELTRYINSLSRDNRETLIRNVLAEGTTLPPALQGVRRVQSCKSEVFKKIKEWEKGGRKFSDLSMKEKNDVLEGIFAKDPQLKESVKWIAVVEAAYFASFMAYMSEKDGILLRVYDIHVRPYEDSKQSSSITDCKDKIRELADDETTLDIYNFMTPTNWSGKS